MIQKPWVTLLGPYYLCALVECESSLSLTFVSGTTGQQDLPARVFVYVQRDDVLKC